MITSVHVGDLRNEGHNVLLVVTAEGWLHVFDFSQDLTKPYGIAEQGEVKKSSGREESNGLLLRLDSSPESVKMEVRGQNAEGETGHEEFVETSRKKSVTFAEESPGNKKDAMEAEEVEKKLLYPSFT